MEPKIFFSAVVLYLSSAPKDLNAPDHRSTWRARYLGKRGVVYIIESADKSHMHFRFHPLEISSGQPDLTKGVSSSKIEEYRFDFENLLFITQKSEYTFRIIDSNIKN